MMLISDVSDCAVEIDTYHTPISAWEWNQEKAIVHIFVNAASPIFMGSPVPVCLLGKVPSINDPRNWTLCVSGLPDFSENYCW